ncbi:ATP-dependent RNA helicase HrpA, partial [Amphibiibacter pelophylacis]
AHPIPPIAFDDALPVSAHRHDLAEAIRAHQVVIVCGETGSGKTTQLPKIALTLGRGRGAGGQGLIGHTQPRRIAATSVAKRIAEELKTPLGEVVGYKIRFADRLQSGASVKLMTDGVLLAETQSDPDLRAYDTLIIDEAHERSLNIDFLLGYLRQLLPRRPDLKIIITSATIDADRFAQHFASRRGPAPVFQVSGRLFPVEQRWMPFEDSRDYSVNHAIADAVDDLWRQGPGDVLVFLPGEREIRDAADHLRGHHPPGVQILPLFSRQSQAEQERVFEAHGAPRIVLATNVAETSLTVPGIRYVVDTGLARVKRYSYRNKVEQLHIEPVSQAAANQRAGRCGRVSNGVCIRLYDEADFAARPAFSDPEILRSSLAGVILRMKSLRLGDVHDFPFLEPPPRKAIADGLDLLAELGALDDDGHLSAIGRDLARLPLDPRVGRMLLEARQREALDEVLIIASALSVQDVRDRPPEQQQAADQKHKVFLDERSEFLSTVRLWRWLDASRNREAPGSAPGQPPAAGHRLSHRQFDQHLREHFINPRRVREWRDTHQQLRTVVLEHQWRVNTLPATYEQLHLSLLAGLLGNIGCKSDEGEAYLGARGIRFYRHPGAQLSKKPGKWLVAAELVDTTRLYGRGLAAIEPDWLEGLAGHLIKTQMQEPHWEKKAGEVVALQRGLLYGLQVYHGRRVRYATVDLPKAREMFIRHALVDGDWDSKLPFVLHNRKLIASVEKLEHKARRQDVLVDDELIFAFYDQNLPDDVCSARTLERWYRHASRQNPELLCLNREQLMRHEAAGITTDNFPHAVRLGGIDCSASYLHEPGHARDGLTVTVPLYVLNQVSAARCDWLVPGMLHAKVLALLKNLPGRPRHRLQPLAEFATVFSETAAFGEGDLLDALAAAIRQQIQLVVSRNDFRADQLPAHHLMLVRVIDDSGRQMGLSRNVSALQAELGGQARTAFQALAQLRLAATRTAPETAAKPAPASDATSAPAPAGRKATAPAPAPSASAPAVDASQAYTAWTFGELPELMEIRRKGQTLVGFPALIDKGTQVEIDVLDEPEAARALHAQGLRRLIALQIRDSLKYLDRNLPDWHATAMAFVPLGDADLLRQQVLDVAISRAFLAGDWPTDAASFERCLTEGRPRLTLIAQEVARLTGQIVQTWSGLQRRLKDSKAAPALVSDIQQQLQRLVGPGFVRQTPYSTLQHFPRYLQAIALRLDKWRADPDRDLARMTELRTLETPFWKRLHEQHSQSGGKTDERLNDFRWLLEELRVSLFAQELRTPQPVSVKRLQKAWGQLQY